MQSLLQHKLILIIAGVVVAGVVWYGLSPSSESPDLTSTPSAGGSASADPGIVSILLSLRTVKLDGTIFSTPTFTQLRDFSTEIVSEPVGRTNPFAPLYAPNSVDTNTPTPANL